MNVMMKRRGRPALLGDTLDRDMIVAMHGRVACISTIVVVSIT